MPQVNATTVNGTSARTAIALGTVENLTVWFKAPTVAALRFRPVGTLRIIEVVTIREIIAYSWPVIYPGIFPIYFGAVKVSDCVLDFQCFRPGLAFTMLWTGTP